MEGPCFLTASMVHFRALGCGHKMSELRVFKVRRALKMAVEVGFVVGTIPAITPTGSATCRFVFVLIYSVLWMHMMPLLSKYSLTIITSPCHNKNDFNEMHTFSSSVPWSFLQPDQPPVHRMFSHFCTCYICILKRNGFWSPAKLAITLTHTSEWPQEKHILP